MDETLRGGLNPYSNGLPSRGDVATQYWYGDVGLNPYSNGLPSRGGPFTMQLKNSAWSLNPYSNGLPSRGLVNLLLPMHLITVLIPILMDYPLGETVKVRILESFCSLNPYSNGLPSRG